LDENANKSDSGYAIILIALLAIPLLTAVGLAVDVGSWYLRASRMQSAADAAALAGVIYQPDFATAKAAARDEAAVNGFEDGVDGVVVEVTETGGERLQVLIHDPEVKMFFSHLVLDEMTLTRSTVAEYRKPIPMGSESNVMGNTGHNVPGDPNFWLAVNGPYSKYESGDPYSTHCLGVPDPLFQEIGWVFTYTFSWMAVGDDCVGDNPQYREDGYWFAVDVAAEDVGNVINLWAFDIAWYERNNAVTETGDHYKGYNALEPWHVATGSWHPLATEVVVHGQDGTPLDYTDNPIVCSNVDMLFEGEDGAGWGQARPDPKGYFENEWAHLNAGCTFTATQPGIYPIQVKSYGDLTNGFGGDGTNAFSLGATLGSCPNPLSSCSHPRVYALGDMSLYFNSTGSSVFQLAEIDNERAGETFIFRAFDIGDGDSSAVDSTIRIVPPPGETLATCDYNVWDETGVLPVLVSSGTSANCEIVTDPGGAAPPYYNGMWLEIFVPIAPTYDCEDLPANCWWSVEYSTTGTVRDFVTFQIYSEADPVHLVG
jgi:hypothetical protein